MKTPLLIALATLLSLCGCSAFRRSPTWDTVVASRSHSSGSSAGEGKDGYLHHLHQVLRNAGIAHKVVTYEFRYHNVYREEAVQTVSAILYRDDITPQTPWWVMDEYHHVPVWLPNWELDAQLEFFIQRRVEILAVKDYPAARAPEPRLAKVLRNPPRTIVHDARSKKFRTLFVGDRMRARPEPSARKPAAPLDSDPRTATMLSGRSAATGAGAEGLFRSAHGTAFDPASSVDRAKINELRRQLLNRPQRISLRN